LDSRYGDLLHRGLVGIFFGYLFCFHPPASKEQWPCQYYPGRGDRGTVSGFFAFPAACLNFLAVFIVDFFKGAGAFICNAGRSSLIAGKSKNEPEEAAAFDTIFSPLGTALGSLTAGLLIAPLGYRRLFFTGSAVVLAVVVATVLAENRKN